MSELYIAAPYIASFSWSAIYAQTTDPLILGQPWNNGGILTFSAGVGFTFNRPGGVDGYLRPDGTSIYIRA